jgi:hypothetical protein
MKKILLIFFFLSLYAPLIASSKTTVELTRFEKIQATVAVVASTAAYLLWVRNCLKSDSVIENVVGGINTVNVALTSVKVLQNWEWYYNFLKSIIKKSKKKEKSKVLTT